MSEAMNEEHSGRPLDVSIAIVSHGHFRYIEPCLASLYEQTNRARFEVTLVDNVGESDIPDLLRCRFPKVRLIVNERPIGFSQNNNLAFRGSTSRYYFLLNPDTVLRENALDSLVDYMDAHPQVGACGPKLLYTDGELQLSCRRFPSLGSVLLRRTPLRRLFPNAKTVRRYDMTDWDHASCRPIDWIFGAAIFARREAWESVGPLDTSLFLFCEDIDWCLRCHVAGWEIHYVAHAVIVHDFDEEKYNRYFTRSRFAHYKTMLQFFLKYPRYCVRW